jgi:hypothetical protein
MEKNELSRLYHLACTRVHSEMDSLYEKLHDRNGEPLDTVEGVGQVMYGLITRIGVELDLIKEAVKEYNGR